MKKNNLKNIVFLFILFISLLVVIIGLSSRRTETDTQSNWVLQTNLQTLLNGRTVNDMTFVDSLTGFAVTSNKSPGDTGYIFKTTNGGSNWFVSFRPFKNFSKIKFINDSLGFACGGSGGGTSYFCKTTDRGNTWIGSSYGATYFSGMCILNKDTIYICDNDSFVGGLFRTTNGGTNWQQIYSAGIYNPTNIYMFNSRIGFYCGIAKFYKTSDGGFNWTYIDDNIFYDIKFIDSLTGYRAFSSFQKTTNGGLNWITQILPNVPGLITTTGIIKFQMLNKDTVLGVGGMIWYPPNNMRGLINKTTNGGLNWGYQLPDTHNIPVSGYAHINFINFKKGWIYNTIGTGIYTDVGGDTTLYTNIHEQINAISKDFRLFQNYPNPFNPTTNIKVKMNKRGFAELKIFDIAGKFLELLINKYENQGEYIYKYDAKDLSSGVYFYSLFIDGIKVDTKKLMLIK